MTEQPPTTVIRKSIAILVIKITILQMIVIAGYIAIRLSKLVVFRQLVDGDDYHDLNFWLGIVAFVAIILAQTAILTTIVLQWFNEFYEIRKDLIVHTSGVFKRKKDIYSLKTIEAGNVVQTLPGKILNYGTVRIYSPVLKREYFINEISNPHNVREAVIALLSANKDNDKKIIPKESAL